jgi:hypothetical protein
MALPDPLSTAPLRRRGRRRMAIRAAVLGVAIAGLVLGLTAHATVLGVMGTILVGLEGVALGAAFLLRGVRARVRKRVSNRPG